jgi:hypothetical protein
MVQRLYNGKNRTPFVKDAFHDHIIPSHRPKEPEPEKTTDAGLPTRSPKVRTPKLPGATPLEGESGMEDRENAEDGREDGEQGVVESNGDADGRSSQAPEQVVTPPPRATTQTGARRFVNPDKTGTKAAAHYVFTNVPPKGGCVVVRLKMTPLSPQEDPSILDEELFDDNIDERRTDADEFYGKLGRGSISDDLQNIMRQALSGMLWWVVAACLEKGQS